MRVGGPLATPAAFDLVATSEGAVLLWAPPDACTRGLSVQRFDSRGRPQAEAEAALGAGCGSLAGARVVELAAAAAGGRLALAWIVQGAGEAKLLASFGADTATTFAPAQALGPVEANAGRGRGRLQVVAAPSGEARIAWQAPRAACVGGSGSCAQIVSAALPNRDGAGERGTDTREVPGPCPRLLVGSIWRAGVFYDAFCAFDPTGSHPTTQVYAVRPEIFYAEALPSLVDCEPLGLSPSAGGAVVWGRCPDGLRAHALAAEGGSRLLSPAIRSVACRAGRPQLKVRAGTSDASLTLALDAPLARLEAWLPEGTAPEGARAVFTGQRLLSAIPSAGRVTLRRHECEARGLVSNSPSML